MIMFLRRRIPSVLGLCFAFSAVAYAQAVPEKRGEHQPEHEHGVEEIKPPPVPLAPDAKQADLAATGELIQQQTNRFRKELGRDAVTANPVLMQTAADFARFMAKTNKFSHTADGNQPNGRARQHGYDPCLVAENIAVEFSSRGFTTSALATKFVQGWKHSPGHCKNMLDPDVIETGVGVAQSETGFYYAVQMFGRPRSKSISFRVANKSGTTVEYWLGDRSFKLPPDYTETHTLCRRLDLRLQPPQTKPTQTQPPQPKPKAGQPAAKPAPKSNPLHPGDGDRFVIVTRDGEIRIEKE
jgi:uncharacterized protein YkwD